MSLFHQMVRGGQTNIHFISMLRQVVKVGFTLSFCFILIVLGVRTTQALPSFVWKPYGKALISELNFFESLKTSPALLYHNRPPVKKLIKHVHNTAQREFWTSLRFGAWFFVGVLIFWVALGKHKNKATFHRGAKLTSVRRLRLGLFLKRKGSDMKLGPLPLVKGRETSHMLVSGTTGTGKTNLFNTLLPQIRRRPNRAIIVDLTGDYTSRFYDPSKDLLLNPFDARSQKWSPWCDWTTDYECDQLTSAIIPRGRTHQDPFWENGSKAILTAAMQKLKELNVCSTKRLHEIIAQVDLKAFEAFFQETHAAPYTDKEGEKMTLSLRATLANHLQAFKYLEDTGIKEGFSVREWVRREENPDQWLFITAMPDQRESLRPFMSAWLEVALCALMSLPPCDRRRLWFVVDELPALNQIPSLQMGLAEMRKYGGCVVAGIQSISQINSLYPKNEAQSILDLFNTYVFFRSNDPTTTQWISEVLGKTEETKVSENVSYGVNVIRDGVSLNNQRTTSTLVMGTQIAGLKNLEAYVRLPENFPVTCIKMPYKKTPRKETAFMPLSLPLQEE